MNFYDSIIEGAQELSPADRGQLYAACLEFLFYGREPDFPMRSVPHAMFVMVRPVLENQRARQSAGSKGGKARAERQAEAKQSPSTGASRSQAEAKQSPSKAQARAQAEAKQSPSEQEQEQEVEELGANAPSKKSRPRFVPPTPEEVDAYIAERGYSGFDGEQFCAFYASKGWRVGREPMRSWRHAVVTWWKDRQPGGRRFAQAAGPERGRESFDAIDWDAYEVVGEEVAT